jgi:hypothetical protein
VCSGSAASPSHKLHLVSSPCVVLSAGMGPPNAGGCEQIAHICRALFLPRSPAVYLRADVASRRRSPACFLVDRRLPFFSRPALELISAAEAQGPCPDLATHTHTQWRPEKTDFDRSFLKSETHDCREEKSSTLLCGQTSRISVSVCRLLF